jgi:hypothetical protein
LSFSISIAGHSNSPHNQAVREAVEAALERLKQVPGLTGSVSGYSWENDSDKIDLGQSFAAESQP